MSIKSTTVLGLSALVSVAQAVNHDVMISGLTYVPSTVNAAVGDTVAFHFSNSAHDVVQGSFSAPCTSSSGGFYSGTSVSGKKFVVTIQNTDPIYFYCSTPGHCQAGMVGGINTPNSGNTVSAFTTAAKSAGRSSSPDTLAGGQLLDENAVISSSSSPSSSTTTGATQAGSSTMTSAASSASSAASSRASAASSIVSSISSAAASAASSVKSSATSAAASASASAKSAGSSLVAGAEYGSGKVILSTLAAAGAGMVFWAGLI